MQVMIFFTAVAEYSDVLKESIKSQTEYVKSQSNRLNTIAFRASYILPILKRFLWWKPTTKVLQPI